MRLLRDVSITVENETGCMSVGTHVLKDQPFVHFHSFQLGVSQGANLVETIASRSKHSSRYLLSLLLLTVQLVKASGETHRCRMVVVIDNIVERAVDSVINIKGLSLSFASFSGVYFGSNCRACTNKITARFCNESELSWNT